jgi:hypothetical protein
MTEIMSTWVNEKIWGGTYMSVLDDLKKLLNKVLQILIKKITNDI